MSANYLEQLVAEWYEYQGFFVRRNILVGKRTAGGFDGELDVVAYHPKHDRLVHIEPSMDGDSWAERERRFTKKFAIGQAHIPSLFPGLTLPATIEQIAVFAYASTRNRQTVGGGTIVLLRDLLAEIFAAIQGRQLINNAIPEHLPILRSFQLVAEYRDVVIPALVAPSPAPPAQPQRGV